MAASLSKELVFLILQFLDEEKYKETVHKLEQESGFYFSMRYFEEIVRNGDWDEVEKYLSGFTKVDDNRHSMKIFFEIRKQKYLEALDMKDHVEAVEILAKDLKVFAAYNEELYKDITQLLTLENIRENEQLSRYGDANSSRIIMLEDVKKLIEANPIFREKLQFPTIRNSRLRTLINQSLNWQHNLCKNPKSNPNIQTLFTDHSCGQSNGARAPSPISNALMGGFPHGASFPQIGAQALSQPISSQFPASLTGWMANVNPLPVPHPSASVGLISMAAPNNHAFGPSDPSAKLKRPMTLTNNPALDYQTADSEHILKRSRAFGISDEGSSMAITMVPGGYGGQSHTHAHNATSTDEVPKKVLMTLNQGSAVKSMDFHPVQQILLLVGTNTGDITVWDISTRKNLVQRNFKVWNLGACSVALQESIGEDHTISINRVIWSPDGLFSGAAYSKHIVHIYSYQGEDLKNHREIDAHAGSVNDIAFVFPSKSMSLVTCGDDKVIKVWDTNTGANLFSFEGHEAPVYSVCPHIKENIPFIFSTATDGKIKAWLYDDLGSRVDYDAPGYSSARLAYSADRTRLFSCGTNKEGESHIVEWNESEGEIKRTYHGLGKRSVGIVQFDTAKNQILAAGDEFVIKFWDMDRADVLATTDADGGLPASPCLRFSKEGMLLAVSTDDNGIKILANGDGIRLLLSVADCMVDPSRAVSVAAAAAKAQTSNMGNYGGVVVGASTGERTVPVVPMRNMNCGLDGRPRLTDEPGDKSRAWKPTEVKELSQCRSLRLPDNLPQARIARLIYTNSGIAILALASNGVHKLWKWPRHEREMSGKATTNVEPQLLQSPSGILMTNDINETNLENTISCFALSNNDSYLMSASGGKISLFNLPTFKTMTTFMPPPPAATYLAFHPEDNNIMAIGMDDSSIQIYNVRVDEVKTKLYGHEKRITGLAFSAGLKVLVSAGADSQLCVWSTDGWDKQESKYLQMPPGRAASPLADIRVQFHQDQLHVLVVHETQIAIYSAAKLECLKQWVPREISGSITYATYSCDSQSIYVSFEDASVGVLTSSTLRLRCRINPDSYLPHTPKLHPVVIAAHPSEPSQFALGLNDGGVVVLEPNESEGQWGTAPPNDNGAGCSSTAMVGSSDQQPQQ